MAIDAYETSRKAGEPVFLYLIRGADAARGAIGPFAYTNAEAEIVRDGITYIPHPVQHGDVVASGSLDNSLLTVTLARGTPVDDLFLAYPPGQVVNMTVFAGHAPDEPTNANFPAQWLGKITGCEFSDTETELLCEPVSTSIRRPGLRRNYQRGCPYALYSPQCGASRAAATVTRTVASVSGSFVLLASALPAATNAPYFGGLIEWTSGTGLVETRSIISVDVAKTLLHFRGTPRGLVFGTTVSVSLGCNHTMDDCAALHANLANYGGQPWIPLDNPFAFVNQFF